MSNWHFPPEWSDFRRKALRDWVAAELKRDEAAQRIAARSDETLQAAQPAGQEPDGEADRAAAEEMYRFAESLPCYCEQGDDQLCRRCVVLAKAKGEE